MTEQYTYALVKDRNGYHARMVYWIKDEYNQDTFYTEDLHIHYESAEDAKEELRRVLEGVTSNRVLEMAPRESCYSGTVYEDRKKSHPDKHPRFVAKGLF